MTAIDTTNLEALADLTFEDFVGLHAIDQNRAEQYYAELESQAQTAGLLHVENYAALAKGVATGGTVDGQILNNFTGIYADDASIDYSWGSDARLQVQYEAMRADITLRLARISQGGTGELNYQDTIDVQTAALSTIGLGPEASFLYTPLTMLSEHDPGRAQTLFEIAIAGGDNAVVDVVQDGLLLGFGATINGDQSLSEILADYAEQAEWLSNAMEAEQAFITEYGPQGSQLVADSLETLQQLVNLAGATSGGLSQAADWVDSLPPGTAVKLLPPWAQAALAAFEAAKNIISPLVLDIDGDGIELAALNGSGSVYWDIDLDDFGEASGWMAGGDGLLAIDVNADGIINDHSELFGDQTGSPNGFAALAAYDTNTDNAITSADAQFDDLLVWIDANTNGRSEADELHTLDDLSITSISLNYSNVSYTVSGNEIKQESSFVINGQTRDIVDAWFAYDDVNTVYAEDYTLDIRTLFLPSLRGYGKLPDLHIAMSMDETLLDMVEVIATADAATILSPAFDLEGKVTDIMFRWAGVDGVDPGSRGIYIDARVLEVLETFLDDKYQGYGQIDNDPSGASQADALENAFEDALSAITERLLIQSAAAEDLFDTVPSYDLASDMMEAYSSSVDLELGTINGDTITGTTGNNYLLGFEGNDTLHGDEGNDILEGGAGNDTLYGDEGDDRYVFGTEFGNDYLYENPSEGTDVIAFTDGITRADLDIWADSSGHLYFGLDGTSYSQLYVNNNTFSSSTGSNIHNLVERVEFADGDFIDLTQGLYINDTDTGRTMKLGAGNDEVYGNGGDDKIYTYAGNDILVGGAGNDNLYGGAGDDTYMFGLGFGSDSVTENASEGADTIQFVDGITRADLDIWATSSGHLYFGLDGATYSQFYIYNDSFSNNTGSNIHNLVERVEFSDGDFIDLSQGLYINDTDVGRTIKLGAGDDEAYGNGGNDNIYTYAGNDTIHGGDGADSIFAGDGDDILYGGDGIDHLYGQGGADTYAYDQLFTAVDVIHGFSAAEGDKLDLADLISTYDPVSDAITDFVWMVTAGSNTDIYVDQDGAGTTDVWTKIATMQSVTGLTDEAALEANGTLITV